MAIVIRQSQLFVSWLSPQNQISGNQRLLFNHGTGRKKHDPGLILSERRQHLSDKAALFLGTEARMLSFRSIWRLNEAVVNDSCAYLF